jgi:hypothetical protein
MDKDLKILVYTDSGYEYQAKALIESLNETGNSGIQVIYYTVGFNSDIEFPNLIKKRWEINNKHKRFPFYKPEICLDAIYSFGGNILFLDSDIIISKRFNPDFFLHDFDYPMLSVGNWDLPFFFYRVPPEKEFPKFSIGDRVVILDDFKHLLKPGCGKDPTDWFGNISDIIKESSSYEILFDGDDTPIEIPEKCLELLDIKDFSKLMRYYGVTKPSMGYVYSCCISFNQKCERFIREWKSITENEYLNSFDREYYPIAEETSINVCLWKNRVKSNYGRIFVNTLFSEVVEYVEKSENIKNQNIFDNPLQKCDDSERVQFYHGIIDSSETDKIIKYYKQRKL